MNEEKKSLGMGLDSLFQLDKYIPNRNHNKAFYEKLF